MMLTYSCGCDGGGNDRPYNNFLEKAWTESDGGQGTVPISKFSKCSKLELQLLKIKLKTVFHR